MVNGKFPNRNRYGFEMVDAPVAARADVWHRQWKIYAESNPSSFTQIGPSAHTRDLSGDGISGTDCETNRNGVKEKRRRGREMFFLIRMAFWLGLVLVLLPRDTTPESGKLPKVEASQAISAATAAVSDMSQFCTRQPAACEVGGEAASVIGQRAKDGARKVYRFITDKRSSDETGSIGEVENTGSRDVAQDTLTSDDLQAEWKLPSTARTASN
jgi:hypothetical protein